MDGATGAGIQGDSNATAPFSQPTHPAARTAPSTLSAGVAYMHASPFVPESNVMIIDEASELPVESLSSRAVGQSPRIFAHRAMPTSQTPYEHRIHELPAELVNLNNLRAATGAKELAEYQKKHSQPKPPAKPLFLETSVPGIETLKDGLKYILRPLPAEGGTRHSINSQEREKDINKWFSAFREYAKQTNSNNSLKELDLLVELNEMLDKSDWKLRKQFYKISEETQFLEALNLVQKRSKSVRIMKEIEEFEDAREEFMDAQEK
jgi:hypothetical protein